MADEKKAPALEEDQTASTDKTEEDQTASTDKTEEEKTSSAVQIEEKETSSAVQIEEKNTSSTVQTEEDKTFSAVQIEEKSVPVSCVEMKETNTPRSGQQTDMNDSPISCNDGHKAVGKVLSVCLSDVCLKDVCLRVSEVDISGMRRKRKPLEVDDVIIQKMRKLELQQTTERKVLKRKKTPCDWAQLPDGALGQIYVMACHKDRLSMSMACKHWHEAFKDSEKWTTLTFRINASMPMRAMDFTTRKIPSEIKHLIIDCYDPKATDRSGDSKLLALLRHLLEQKADKLLTLHLLNVSRMTNKWKEISRSKDVIMCIRGLIHFQTQLEELHLTNAGLDMEQGTVVLKKVGNSCGAKIKTLYIDGLFLNEEKTTPEDITSALLQGLSSFTKIQTLSLTDYYLTEGVMEFLSNQSHLKRLYLESLDQELNPVTNQCLQRLRLLCPKLKIQREDEKIEFYPEDQEAELTVDAPAETPEMIEDLEICEDQLTPPVENLQNHHAPQDMQNHHAPQDMQNHHTLQDLQNHHTPQGTHELTQDSETVEQGSHPRYRLRRRNATLNYRV